jgi:hypothetical protein
MVMTMVCRTWTLASCISEEVWPESVGAEVLSWARSTAMPGEVSGLQCSYQGTQKAEVVSVAKYRSSRRSGARVIAHRRYVHGRWCPGEVLLVDLGRAEMKQHVKQMRKTRGRITVLDREMGKAWSHRNRRRSTAVAARCRSRIRAAWSPGEVENQGEGKRGWRPSYRRGLASKRQGIKGELRGGVTGRFQWGRGRGYWGRRTWQGGSTCQRGKGEKWVPVRDWLAGPRASLTSGPKGFPRGPSLFFCSLSFSLFCFLISFVDFAKLLQINSNHFQKFSKIQSIKVGQ